MADKFKETTELEKVIQGLESCRPGRNCGECPYHDLFEKGTCNKRMEADALELLKAQMPRVLDKRELTSWDGIVWFEERGCIPRVAELDTFRVLYSFSILRYEEPFEELTRMYGKTWRCWTAKPTDEQRKAVKWDE